MAGLPVLTTDLPDNGGQGCSSTSGRAFGARTDSHNVSRDMSAEIGANTAHDMSSASRRASIPANHASQGPPSPHAETQSMQSSRGRLAVRQDKPSSRHSSQYSEEYLSAGELAAQMDYFDPTGAGFYGAASFEKAPVEMPSDRTSSPDHIAAFELPAELPREFDIAPTFYPPPTKKDWAQEVDRRVTKSPSPIKETEEWVKSQSRPENRRSLSRKSLSSVSPISTPTQPADEEGNPFPAPLTFQSRSVQYGMASVPTFHPPDSKATSPSTMNTPTAVHPERPPNNRHSISQPLTYTYTYGRQSSIPPIAEGVTSDQSTMSSMPHPARSATMGAPAHASSNAPQQPVPPHRQSISGYPSQMSPHPYASGFQSQFQQPHGLPNQFHTAQGHQIPMPHVQYQQVQLPNGQMQSIPVQMVQDQSTYQHGQVQLGNPSSHQDQTHASTGQTQFQTPSGFQQTGPLQLQQVQLPSGQVVYMAPQQIQTAQPQETQVGAPLQQAQSNPQASQATAGIDALTASTTTPTTTAAVAPPNPNVKKLKSTGLKALIVGAKVATNVAIRVGLQNTVGVDPGNVIRVQARPQRKPVKQSSAAATKPDAAAAATSTQANNTTPATGQAASAEQQSAAVQQTLQLDHANQQAAVGHQQPLANQQASVNQRPSQQTAAGQQPAMMYQQTPTMHQQYFMGQQSQLMNQQPPLNYHPQASQQTPLGHMPPVTQQFHGYQQPHVFLQPQPMAQQPHPLNQQPPMQNQQSHAMNQHPQTTSPPNPTIQKPPQNQQTPINQQSPLSQQPPSNQQAPTNQRPPMTQPTATSGNPTAPAKPTQGPPQPGSSIGNQNLPQPQSQPQPQQMQQQLQRTYQQPPGLIMQDINQLGMQIAQNAIAGGFSSSSNQSQSQPQTQAQVQAQIQAQLQLQNQTQNPNQNQSQPQFYAQTQQQYAVPLYDPSQQWQGQGDPSQQWMNQQLLLQAQSVPDLSQLSLQMDNSALAGGLAANDPTYTDPSQYWAQAQAQVQAQQQQQYGYVDPSQYQYAAASQYQYVDPSQYSDPNAMWNAQMLAAQQGLLAAQTAQVGTDVMMQGQAFVGDDGSGDAGVVVVDDGGGVDVGAVEVTPDGGTVDVGAVVVDDGSVDAGDQSGWTAQDWADLDEGDDDALALI